MRRIFLGLLVVAAAAALLTPASAPAATYSWWIGCDDTTISPPSHKCLTTDYMAAYFEADEFTEYEVCIGYPSEIFLFCSPPFEAEAETLYSTSFKSDEVGQHEAVWYIAETDTEIGRWEFTVEAPPAPPPSLPPPVAPILAAPVPVTGGTECLAAKQRVIKLRARLRRATTQKRKARLRAQLKKARAAVNRAC